MPRSGSATRPKAPSAIILKLGTPGGIDRQMSYFTSLAPTALPDWKLTTFETHGSRWRSLLTLPAKALRFGWLCMTRRFSLCHVNLAPRGSTYRKAVYCAICGLLGVPYVLHLHGSNYHEFYAASGRPGRALVRWLFHNAARVVVLGRVWRDFVRNELGVSADKITIVANAVPGPVALDPGLRSAPPVILFLGIVGKRKGIDVLLQALAVLQVDGTEWTAIVAGDGEVEVYSKAAMQLGLADRVRFAGWCDDVETRKLLQAASILVLPSRAENLPLSLLEGMAYGLCPIVTPVGAVAEVVTHDVNGLLVPVGDAPALTLALADVLTNPAKLKRLGDAARASYESRYDARHYPGRLGQVYRAAAGLEPQDTPAVPAVIRPKVPMISVIINNYNYGRFVADAIRSALQQDYPNVECIAVDDGSTDDSLAVMRSFANVCVVATPNGGQISAAMRGFARARGDVILFLDSDDYLHPGACSAIAEAYSPNVSMYQFRLEKRAAGERRVGTYPQEPFVRTALAAHVRRYGYLPSSPTSGNAFSRSHVQQMFDRIVDPPKLYFDGYLIYSAAFTGEIKIIDRELGVYRVHGSNVSMSGGRTLRTAKNDILNAIWQRTAIVQCLQKQGEPALSPLSFLSPYHLRNALILRIGYPQEQDLQFMSKCDLAAHGMYKFCWFPNLSPWQRIKNVALLALLPLAPALARRIIPREAKATETADAR